MLVALQIDTLPRIRCEDEAVVVLQVDVLSDEAFPDPRHVFYGQTSEEAEERFMMHCAQDRWLRQHVERGAIVSAELQIVPEDGTYPEARHVFYGISQEDTEQRFADHANQDPYLRHHVDAGRFESSWRQVPFKDKGSRLL